MIPGDTEETVDETDTGKDGGKRGVGTVDRSYLHRLVVTQCGILIKLILSYCLGLSQQN